MADSRAIGRPAGGAVGTKLGTPAISDITALEPYFEQLPNGMRLIVLELPGLHRVVIDTHLRVGSRYETTKTNGLSHFLEHMLYRGSPSHPSAQQLAFALESLGCMLLAATATDSGALTTSTPPENFAAAFALYAEVFQQPVLGGIDVERGIVLQEILEGLDEQGRSVDPDNLIRALAFPDHALGFPITGTIAQLESFDQAMLRAHHDKHYTASNTVMAIAGPLTKDRVLEQVRKAFQDLPQGHAILHEPPANSAGPKFLHVRDSGSQVTLRVAFRAPGVHAPDEPAVDLLLRLIDDGMSTQLYRRLCDDKGLCYDVSAGYEAYVDVGLFELRAETSADRAQAVLGEMFRIVADLRDRGPEPAELEKCQQRHYWQLREMLDSPEALTNFYALGALHNTPRSPLARHQQLSGLDCASVAAAAARLFHPSNLSVVAVGLLSKKEQATLERMVSEYG